MANKKIQELTVSGFEKLQAEYRQLNDVEKVQNQEDVATARAQGDLSENADYDAARARQGEIEDRLRQIEEAKQNSLKNSYMANENNNVKVKEEKRTFFHKKKKDKNK